MSSYKKPLLSDEFLDELAKEISQLYGGSEYERDLSANQGYWQQNSREIREK